MPPFEAFLALRYLRPRRTFVSIITVISVVGVLLGVAVMIIVISVMSGFDQEWHDRILGFNAAMEVYNADLSPVTNAPALMKEIQAASTEVIGVSPFIGGEAVLQSERTENDDTNVSAAYVDGVDPETQAGVTVIPGSIIRGKYDVSDKGILLGLEMADRLGLTVGDRLALYSGPTLQKFVHAARDSNALTQMAADFTVRGIFDVQFASYNRTHVVISLDDATRVFDLPEDSVNGIAVKLRNPYLADEVGQSFAGRLKEPVRVLTWREKFPDIFDALAVEKETMFIILFFIMIVAAFGIINCQIIFVVQKTREIGILKALGANNSQILCLFLSQSVIVGVLGVGLGFCLALLALHYRNNFLHFMREVTHTELLPSSIYQLSGLPSSIEPHDVAVICGTAFCACVLAGLFPAWKASRLQPVEALRHE
jgi:lipoprotein-releasing system permease protein